MTKHQKEYLEMRINDIWFVIDRNGNDEDRVKRLCGELEGIRIALLTLGYHVSYDMNTGKRRIITDKQWKKQVG